MSRLLIFSSESDRISNERDRLVRLTRNAASVFIGRDSQGRPMARSLSGDVVYAHPDSLLSNAALPVGAAISAQRSRHGAAQFDIRVR